MRRKVFELLARLVQILELVQHFNIFITKTFLRTTVKIICAPTNKIPNGLFEQQYD